MFLALLALTFSLDKADKEDFQRRRAEHVAHMVRMRKAKESKQQHSTDHSISSESDDESEAPFPHPDPILNSARVSVKKASAELNRIAKSGKGPVPGVLQIPKHLPHEESAMARAAQRRANAKRPVKVPLPLRKAKIADKQ